MSVVPARIKCDQCGTVATYKEAGDWLTVRSGMHQTLMGHPVADLCSWPCLRDYATVQVLDPDSA